MFLVCSTIWILQIFFLKSQLCYLFTELFGFTTVALPYRSLLFYLSELRENSVKMPYKVVNSTHLKLTCLKNNKRQQRLKISFSARNVVTPTWKFLWLQHLVKQFCSLLSYYLFYDMLSHFFYDSIVFFVFQYVNQAPRYNDQSYIKQYLYSKL